MQKSGAAYAPIRAAQPAPAPAPFVPPPASSSPAVTWATPVATGYPKVPQYVSPAVGAPAPAPAPGVAVDAGGLVSSIRAQGHALLSSQKPWKEFLHVPAFSLPTSLGDAFNRSRRNLAYFRSNYLLIVLVVVLSGFIWHPTSLIALGILIAAWYFLYFGRTSNAPLELMGRSFDDGTVLIGLAALTVVCLMVTGLGWEVIGSLLTGVTIVVGHSVLRSTEDLYLTEQEAAVSAGVVAAATGGAVLPTYVRPM